MLSTAAHINYGAKSQIPKVIVENPFRILGVFANSSQKEIVANQGKANAFLKVGRAVEYPLDLGSILPKVDRNIDIFNKANANLTIAKERLKFAQFWFLKMTPLDDVAFNHLYAGNWQQAIEIWDKKNCVSSLQNKVVTNFITNNFDQAINTAEDLYEQFSDDFLKAADTTGTLDLFKDDLIHSFINTLCSEFEPKKIYNIVFTTEWKDYLGNKTVKPIIDKINAEIKTAKEANDDDAEESLEAGEKLLKNTKSDFAQLKKILPSDDAQLENIADKLGLQILQCGINYYNNSDDDDAAEKAMVLQKAGSQIVMGEMAKDRCKENLKVLEKIIAELPPKEIRSEHNAIMEEIEDTLTISPDLDDVKSLLDNTKSYLQSIKSKLGSSNSHYLHISTMVVNIAMRIAVAEVNQAQENAHKKMLLNSNTITRLAILVGLKKVIQNAWEATLLMDEFDIESNFKSHYNQNRNALKSMCEEMKISTAKPTPRQTISTPEPTKKVAIVSSPTRTSSTSISSSTPKSSYPTNSINTTNPSPNNTSQTKKDDDKIDWGIVIFIHIVYGFLSFIPGFGERGLNPILNFLLGMVAGLGFWVIPLNLIPYKIIKWIKTQM